MLKIITKTKDIYNNNYVNQNINNKNISNIKSKNNINKLLILLVFIFGIGFNSGMVYGSSEASDIPMKSEDYLFNHILRNKDENLFGVQIIIDGLNITRGNILREALITYRRQLVSVFPSGINEEEKKLKDDFITKINNFISQLNHIPAVDYVSIFDVINNSIEAEKEIKAKFPKFPRKNLESIIKSQTTMIDKNATYDGIVDILLARNLWIAEHRSYSYSIIRRINDLLLYDDGIVTDLSKKALLDSLNKPLIASRRLLLSSIVDSDLVLNGSSLMEDISTKFSEEGYDSIIISRIDRKLDILPKSDGKQFGFKLIIEDKTTKDKSSFFVKSYMGYYGNAIKFSYGNETSSSPLMINSQESRSMSSTKVRSILNLKEPFMYSLLNKLNFAPEVHFIINPYITGGFFIATADLNNESKKERFFEIGHIAGKTKKTNVATGLEDESIGFIQLFNIELEQPLENKNPNIFTELTKIDMLARIFRLEDFNTGNFGCVIKIDELEENKFTEVSLNNCEFKVIDFAPYTKDENYTDSSISNNFISGNTTINYSDESIMAKALKNRLVQEKFFFGFRALRQFQSRLGIPIPHTFGVEGTEYFLALNPKREYIFIKREDVTEIDEFMLEQILFSKTNEIRSLMLEQRGTDDKPQEVMLRHPLTKLPRTNAELIGFKLGKKPEDYNPSEGQLDYIEDAFEDLDNYCKGIMNNYKTLKRFIIDGYYKYFDGQGNPKIQSVLEE